MKKFIDQKRIVSFVNAVETKKKFARNPDKVFRHIVSELGELDRAMYNVERIRKDARRNKRKEWENKLNSAIGEELVDLLFLVSYMADLYQINLNSIIPERIKAISEQYSVKWEGV